MAADVEQNDLLVGDHHSKRNPVAVGDAYRVNTLQFAGQVVAFKMGLKRVNFKVVQDGGEFGIQVTMLLCKLFGSADKAGSPDKGIHTQPSRPSSLISSAALPRLTRPAFTSSSEAFTRATYASSASATSS